MNYRTLLFIPGNNPGMLQTSDVLGADGLIIDLEDAVALSEKDTARLLVSQYLREFPMETDIFIRVNPVDTPYFEADMEEIKDLDIEGIVLPESSIESVKILDRKLRELDSEFKVIALVETALGLETVFQLAQESKSIIGVFLGAEDLTLDLGAKRSKESEEIAYARSKVISATKALNLQSIDTPFTDTEDIEGLKKDTNFVKDMGMTGKSLISPRHVDIVNEIFAPTKEEVHYATRVMEAVKDAKKKGLGVFSLDGEMVDAPVIMRAVNLLKLSGDYKEEYDELLR